MYKDLKDKTYLVCKKKGDFLPWKIFSVNINDMIKNKRN